MRFKATIPALQNNPTNTNNVQ